MTIQERIHNDLINGIKNREINKVKHLRVIMGELQRLDKKKLSDKEIEQLLTSMAKKANKNINKYRCDVKGNTELITIIEKYTGMKHALTEITEDEIKTWIEENVDFRNFKNRMNCMGMIMQHFKGRSNPKLVQKVLKEMENVNNDKI